MVVQGPLQPGHLQISGDGLDLLGDVVELVVARAALMPPISLSRCLFISFGGTSSRQVGWFTMMEDKLEGFHLAGYMI